MNDKQQAAADLQWLSRRLRGIIALGDDLDMLGSLDRAKADAAAKIEAMNSEARTAARDIAARAEAERADKLREAQKQADAIIAAGRAAASDLVKKATAEVSDMTDAATAAVSASQKHLADLMDQIKAKQDELKARCADVDRISAQITATEESRRADVERISAQIESAQKQLGEAQAARDHAVAEHLRIKQMIEGIRL